MNNEIDNICSNQQNAAAQKKTYQQRPVPKHTPELENKQVANAKTHNKKKQGAKRNSRSKTIISRIRACEHHYEVYNCPANRNIKYK